MHSFLKNFFKSRFFTQENKLDLLETFLGNDQSSQAEKCRAGCLASLPNPEIKASIWDEITDPNSADSLVVRNAKMAEFYCSEQVDIIQPFFSMFFDTLYEQKDSKQFQSFFNCLLPVMDSKINGVKRLQRILKDTTPSTDKAFIETLTDGIDLLKKASQIRLQAAADLEQKKVYLTEEWKEARTIKNRIRIKILPMDTVENTRVYGFENFSTAVDIIDEDLALSTISSEKSGSPMSQRSGDDSPRSAFSHFLVLEDKSEKSNTERP